MLLTILLTLFSVSGTGPTSLVIPGRGGPDVYGYTYRDNDSAGGPQYQWLDIRSRGATRIRLGDDNISGVIPIGFVFPFYWLRYNACRISSNGYISLADDYNGGWPWPDVPDAQHPNCLLASLMSDLDCTGLEILGRRGV